MTRDEDEGPYLGLRTYEEADANRYFGREDIVAEVARMVTRAPVTVLFGVSGTGKSSMIRAGVFPVVRENQILPILIRLGFSKEHPDLGAQLRHAIAAEITAHQIDTPPPGDDELLHEYFARNPFWTASNQLVTPLLVFDQFEEIFTISQDRAVQVEGLMKELALLADRVPRALAAELEIVAPRPRMMFVLREDFLAHLEDYRPIIPALAGNRYRLTRMNGDQALKAVMNPGGKLVTEDTARKIVYFVASGADAVEKTTELRPLETLEVEPAILSLVCQQLDLLRRRLSLPQITSDLIASQGGKIVEKFYDTAFAALPSETRALVEDVLVTSDGYRTTMSKAAALETEGVTKESIEKLLAEKILREEMRFGSLHIELIHDRLTKIASQSRARRRDGEREQARSRRWWRRALIVTGAIVLMVAIAGASFFAYVRAQRRKLEEAERVARETAALGNIRSQAHELAGFLLRDARDALQRGDAPHAAFRVEQARRYFNTAGSPPPPEANLVYKRALVDLVGRVQTIDNGAEIDCVSVLDAKRMLTCGRDGVLRIWRDSRLEREIGDDAGYGPISAAYPDRGGNWVLLLHANGGGEVRMLADKASGLTFDGPTGPRAINVQQSQPPTNVAAPAMVPPPATNVAQQRKLPVARWQACVSPDDSAFAVWAPEVPGVRLWSMPTGKRIESAVLEAARPTELRCLENGKLAWRADYAWTVAAANGTREQTGTFRTNLGPLVASSSGNRLAMVYTPGDAAGIELLDSTFTLLRTPRPRMAQLSADGATLVITSELADHNMFVGAWALAKTATRVFSIDRPSATARFVPANGTTLLVVTSDRRVEAWDTKDWKFLGSATFEIELATARIDVHPVEETFVVVAAGRTTASQRVIVADPAWADSTLATPAGSPQSWIVPPLPSYPFPRRQVALRVDPTLVRLESANGQLVAQLPDAAGSIVDARISSEAEGDVNAPVRVAVLRRDGTVSLYDDQLVLRRELVTDRVVRAITWGTSGELITLGWDRVQIFTADGTRTSTVRARADAVQLVHTPRHVLWTCLAARCSAWDPGTEELLSDLAFEGASAPEFSRFKTWLTLDAQRSLLLPVLRDGDRDLHAMRELTAPAGQIVARNALGASVAFGNDGVARRLGSSLAISDGADGLIVANGLVISVGTPLEHAQGTARVVGSGGAQVIAMSLSGKQLAVIDAELATKVIDLGGGAGPRVEAADIASAGSHAVFSANGARYAYATAGGNVEIRDTDTGGLVGAVKTPARRIRSLLVASTLLPMVAVLGDAELAVFGRGPQLQVVPVVYRQIVMDGDGNYIVGLRLDGQAELRDTNALDKVLLTVPARAIAIDEPGGRVATDSTAGVNIFKPKELDGRKNNHRLKTQGPHDLRFGPREGTYLWIGDRDETDRRFVRRSNDENVKPGKPRDCVFSTSATVALCLYEGPSGLTLQPADLVAAKASGIGFPVSRSPDAMFGCGGSSETFVAAGLSIGDYTSIFVWNPKIVGAEPKRLPVKGAVSCRFTSNGLATLTDAGLLELWNPTSGERTDARGGATLLASSFMPGLPPSGVLSVIGIPGHGAVADVVSGNTTERTTLARNGDVTFAAVAGETVGGDHALVAVLPNGNGEEIRVWPLPFGTASRALDPKFGPGAAPLVTALTGLGDAWFVAAGYADGSVRLWTEKDAMVVLPGNGVAARHIVADEGGRWIAVSYDDGTVSVWESPSPTEATAKREALLRLNARGRTGGAPLVTFQSYKGGPALITGSSDGQIKRWSLGGEFPDDPHELTARALREIQSSVR